MNTLPLWAAGTVALALVAAPHAAADANCAFGGPPNGAATKDVGAVYGQPATLWLTNDNFVGVTTVGGTGSVEVHTPSPMLPQALLVDAQQDGNHQIIVDTGREAHLYAASGCNVVTVVDQHLEPFIFDEAHRIGTGDGVACGDLGNGPHLIGYLNLVDQPGMMRRTEIDLDGATATVGRSDVVRTDINRSCGGLMMANDALHAPF
jgi:hypothetical protein